MYIVNLRTTRSLNLICKPANIRLYSYIVGNWERAHQRLTCSNNFIRISPPKKKNHTFDDHC